MLSSAASLILLVTTSAYQVTSPTRLAPKSPQQEVWTSVSRSIASLQSPQGKVTGIAVLIDDRGIFLAHQVAIPGVESQATIEGHLYTFKKIATDEQTQLVALQAQNWKPSTLPVIKVARGELRQGETLLAATTSGPVQSELVSNDRAGVMKPSLRYTPLQELKLERTGEGIGGALVFNRSGELVGVLGATLEPVAVAKVGMGASGTRQANSPPTQRNFGPQGLTVGYALGPNLINRVVAGFRSESHKVDHPSIGVFFRSSTRQGALIELVKDGSPASKAGIQVGDLVTEANGKAVRSPIEFAILLFNQNVGDELKLKVMRGDKELSVILVVGSQLLSQNSLTDGSREQSIGTALALGKS